MTDQELQANVKEAVQAVIHCLDGFTDWHKWHILECVKEELSEVKFSHSHEAI